MAVVPMSTKLIEVVVPVFDEEHVLERNVGVLVDYLDRHFPFRWRVTIADNASADGTADIAGRLAATVPGVAYLRLYEKGRGRALRAAWSSSDADVVAYMDVDLSTNLESFLPLVAPLLSGHSDIAIGTRLVFGSRIRRRLKREVLSRSYNCIVRALFGSHFSDAQCGFKALTASAAQRLVPLVEDEGWFFDTELLLLAERNGMRIHEVPVDWIEDLDSRVEIVSTAIADLRGLWRVRWAFWCGRGVVGHTAALEKAA